jgi:hypothetical protein
MAATATGREPAKADYGIDAPAALKSTVTAGLVFALFGAIIWYMNRALTPARAVAMLGVLGAIGIAYLMVAAVMVWSSRVGKLRVRDRVLSSLEFRGDEKVLDVGCGRGLFLIGAARRLTSGRGIGVAICRPTAPTLRAPMPKPRAWPIASASRTPTRASCPSRTRASTWCCRV